MSALVHDVLEPHPDELDDPPRRSLAWVANRIADSLEECPALRLQHWAPILFEAWGEEPETIGANYYLERDGIRFQWRLVGDDGELSEKDFAPPADLRTLVALSLDAADPDLDVLSHGPGPHVLTCDGETYYLQCCGAAS